MQFHVWGCIAVAIWIFVTAIVGSDSGRYGSLWNVSRSLTMYYRKVTLADNTLNAYQLEYKKKLANTLKL